MGWGNSICLTSIPMCVAVTISGCATRPLPKDVTRDVTVSIIRKVRCEFQNVLRSRVATLLTDERAQPSTQQAGRDFASWKIGADELAERVRRTAQYEANIIDRIEFFKQVRINYTFNFQIVENNKQGINATFSVPFSGGTLGLVLKNSANFTRNNSRTVTISETFGELAALIDQDSDLRDGNLGDLLGCQHIHRHGQRNALYPITGKIGISEFVATFVKLIDFGTGKKYGALIGPSKYQDVLTFTTMLSTGITPTLTFTPVGPGFNLTKLDGNLDADRKDVHKVTLELEKPKLVTKAKKTGKKKRKLDIMPNLSKEDLNIAREKAVKKFENYNFRDAQRRAFDALE